MDIASEAQVFQRSQECRAESPGRRQPFQFILVEACLHEEFQRLLEPGRDEKFASRPQPADEELEHRGLLHAVVVIALQHGELVEVGEEDTAGGVHGDRLASVMGCAPSSTISSTARRPSPGCTSTARMASLSSITS